MGSKHQPPIDTNALTTFLVSGTNYELFSSEETTILMDPSANYSSTIRWEYELTYFIVNEKQDNISGTHDRNLFSLLIDEERLSPNLSDVMSYIIIRVIISSVFGIPNGVEDHFDGEVQDASSLHTVASCWTSSSLDEDSLFPIIDHIFPIISIHEFIILVQFCYCLSHPLYDDRSLTWAYLISLNHNSGSFNPNQR